MKNKAFQVVVEGSAEGGLIRHRIAKGKASSAPWAMLAPEDSLIRGWPRTAFLAVWSQGGHDPLGGSGVSLLAQHWQAHGADPSSLM